MSIFFEKSQLTLEQLSEQMSTPVLQVHGSIKKHPVKKKVRKLSIKPAERQSQ